MRPMREGVLGLVGRSPQCVRSALRRVHRPVVLHGLAGGAEDAMTDAQKAR